MFNKSGIKFRFIKIAMLLILSALLVSGELEALMSAEKDRGTQSISISPDRYEEFTYRVYEKEAQEFPSQEKADEPMSKEENVTMETIIAEEIKRTKKEKEEIIEKVKEESATTFPERMRSFVVKEEVVEYPPSKPKGAEPLERHNVIMAEKPFLVGLFLLALSVIIYFIYKFTIKKPAKS